MLGGMQSHLDSSVVRIRQMGMVVGECLSSRMNINGTRLKFEVKLTCLGVAQNVLQFLIDPILRGLFLICPHGVLQYDQDEETQELLSLMTPCADEESEPDSMSLNE